MQFPSLNRDRKEWAFGVFRNVRGAAFAAGDSVVLDVASPDGNRVTLAAAATLGLFVGVSLDAPEDTGYFRVQTYGYHSATKIINGTTNVTMPAGSSLKTAASVVHLVADITAPTGGVVHAAYLLETVAGTTVTTAVTKKVFIRAL